MAMATTDAKLGEPRLWPEPDKPMAAEASTSAASSPSDGDGGGEKDASARPTSRPSTPQHQDLSASDVESPARSVTQSPSRPSALNRSVTGQDALINSRPSLLSRQLQYKSSSAVPTLSITAAPAVLNSKPSKAIASSSNSPRTSSGAATLAESASTMTSREPSATDLLKQAMMHRQPEDEVDQIGSTSSTPPGAVTPRPDLIDKRLPGIVHCLSQVGAPTRDSQISTRGHSASFLSVLFSANTLQNMIITAPVQSHSFVKPASKNTIDVCSSLSASKSTDKMVGNLSLSDFELGREAPIVPDYIHQESRPIEERFSSGSSDLNSARSSASSNCVCALDTEKTVSQKADSPRPSLLTRIVSFCNQSWPAKNDKLTESSLHDTQNTPPQTPRTRSQEDQIPSGAVTPKESTKTTDDPLAATIGPVLGKLTVQIREGRGLRPSVDPYVVCEFQLSQYISDGPEKGAGAATDLKAPFNSGQSTAQAVMAGSRKPMAIPMRSRQSSSSGRDVSNPQEVTNPKWNHRAVFDVVGNHAEIDITVYDRMNQEAFLGHVRFNPSLKEYDSPVDGWFPLEARDAEEQESVMGEIHLKVSFQKTDKKHYGPEDFEILKLIGKGTFGQVFQVRKRDTRRIYAMKVLSKKVIVQKKEVQHTIGERNILVRTAMSDSPFIVGLKFSFQTPSDLYLVTDYMSGGELFWHLQKEGRFNETRAKFYVAELILALEHLHKHNIVYRDLKPENILLDANGHIALCDFGLSKANLEGNATTNTFCGTTEYLAPEVLLDDKGYTKMVDFWSLGVLVFEMCCGWSPFYAEETQQMYRNIAFGKVRFPRDALSIEGRNFVKGLLNRNPKHRLGANSGAAELKAHPFFADVDWETLMKKKVVPPFKPKLKSELDVSNFDPEFTTALNQAGSLNARAMALASGIAPASTPISPTMQAKFEGFTFVDESSVEKNLGGRSLELSRHSTRDDDDDWEKIERGDRMSSHDTEDAFFNGGFE